MPDDLSNVNSEPFWLENPIVLFKHVKFIPKPYMTIEEQMNCVTRFVLFIYLILHLIGFNQSVLFLILSIIFIIILYYLQKSKTQMTTYEHYNNDSDAMTSHLNYIEQSERLYEQGLKEYANRKYTFNKYPSYFTQQVEKEMVITPDQSFPSNNQALVGPANPKTRIAPIVSPPVYEWNFWKRNDFSTPNIINTRHEQDFYNSGYYTSDDCDVSYQSQPNPRYQTSKTYAKNARILQNANINNPILNPNNNTERIKTVEKFEPIIENYTYIDTPKEIKGCRSCSLPDPSITVPSQQRINGDFKKFDQKFGDERKVRYSGDIIESDGYDSTNLQYNLPSNYGATNCQRKSNLSDFNREIFTSTIVPGTYYENQIIEPIQSNIGISFDQQVPPRKITHSNGNTIYTAMDPKLYTPVEEPVPPQDSPSTYNVFDPRSNGYGTSYRGYTDKMTGQPRFYYDDVDSIRRPNFLIRTNIDHLKNADSYGPIRDDQDTRNINERIRDVADSAFKDQTLDFRTEMMTRLMRKRNAEMWQRRVAPITGNQQKNFKC